MMFRFLTQKSYKILYLGVYEGQMHQDGFYKVKLFVVLFTSESFLFSS